MSMTTTLPQLTELSDTQAQSIAEGIIGLFDTLQLGWIDGDYVVYDNHGIGSNPTLACAIGVVQLMAGQQLGQESRPGVSRAFSTLFGRDGLEDHELRLLTGSIITGNDSRKDELKDGCLKDVETYAGMVLAQKGVTDLVRRQYEVACFGYRIGRAVRLHFNPEG